ncbi:hypothetical protein HU200_058394 [Digitaria exilis]|uniref:NADH:ubiquinone oxidoreductase 30kDa subunit domain-containing protein n=1 Tax=Digitaria exilis TaxID=1010633 RepID=A0A835A9W8_9POAL|nr:hypothetical protein HU200_058394 [Digitaria exilis]
MQQGWLSNWLVKHEYGTDRREEVCCIKVFAQKDNPRIPSVFWIWRSADFQERESYDIWWESLMIIIHALNISQCLKVG